VGRERPGTAGQERQITDPGAGTSQIGEASAFAGTGTPVCVVCGAVEGVRVLDPEQGLFRCAECTHVFTLLAAAGQRSDGEGYEDEYYDAEHANWFAHPNVALFRLAHSQIRERLGNGPLRVLDVGCGRGDFLQYLQRNDPKLELWGVDLNPRPLPGIDIVCGDVMGHVMDEELLRGFDAITGLALIEHLERPDLFVRRVMEGLRPGGLVIMMTVNNDGLFYRVARTLNGLGQSAAYRRLYSPHHLHHFTNQSLRRLMRSSGLEAVFQENHNYPLRAVDVPEGSPALRAAYTTVVWGLFSTSTLFRNGILQTIVCRKSP